MKNTITDLVLIPKGKGGSSLPLLSCRNCTQTLTPIENGQLRRTVNGRLVHTGMTGHTKYMSLITGEDLAPPALENIWRGTLFQVSCLSYLTQPTLQATTIELSRNPVPGSIGVIDTNGKLHSPLKIQGRKVTLPKTVSAEYISYRPQLDMYAANFKITTNEWGLKVGWELCLEEG